MRLPQIFLNLEGKEKEYFLSLAKSCERELALHENPGKLWEKDERGEDWSNVTEHCLMEAARVGVFAQFLGIENDTREKLISAAAIHDFNKKEEIRLTQDDTAAGGSGRKGVLIMEEENEKILRDADFSSMTISIARHVTGDSEDVHLMKDILDLSEPSSKDIAHLVMYYVDNYTRGSAWVEPAEYRGEGRINDIDRRNEMNALNPVYEAMNREGLKLNETHPFFNGMTRFEAAISVSRLIEKKFVEIMQKRGFKINDPLDIPELVDARIKEDIKSSAL